MDPILTDRQRRLLMLAVVISMLLIDGHALRIFLSARKFLEAQRKSHMTILTSVLKREISIDRNLSSESGGVADSSKMQPVLAVLGTRYGFLSVEILDDRGLLIAASQSGRPLMVPDNFFGIPSDKRHLLLEKGQVQYSVPTSASSDDLQIVSLYVPFQSARHHAILKATFVDESLSRVGQISHDIVIYQLLGIGVTILLLVLVGMWILLPYRRILRTARRARAEVLPDQEMPRDDNAMMISSFHGVIARLKEKEKELTELSRIDREKAETAARMSTDMLQQMDASVFQFSSQGRVLQCNRSASDLFGAPSLVLFNQHYLKLFDGEHEWRQMIENALRLGLKEQDRLLSWKARGERQVFRVSVSPVAEPDGKRGALCIIADVTEKNRLEQQLAEKEKLAALGEMAGGLAHEVRNSLGTIVGLMRLIDTHEMLSADAARADITDNERFQFMMKKEVRELNRIVTDFLDFTRPISLRLDRIDCGEVLRHCLEEIRAQFPDRADDVQVEGQFAPIQGDDAQLRQAFFNLIKNGIESGTNVRVIVSSTVDAATNTLCLRFHDTGAGINADDIERIFIPFYTTKESGYGIGLAIVKKTILEHSGRIEVTSTPGEGTIFTIFLPIVPASSCP